MYQLYLSKAEILNEKKQKSKIKLKGNDKDNRGNKKQKTEKQQGKKEP